MSCAESHRGSVLLWWCVALCGLLTLAGLVMQQASAVRTASAYTVTGLQTRYVAESGLNWALGRCAAQGLPDNVVTKELAVRDGYQNRVTVDPQGTRATITSVAVHDAERITLVIKINCVPKGEGKWEIGVSECKS